MKTPRTDKQVHPKGAYGQSAVSADFARQLERELTLAVNALHHIALYGGKNIETEYGSLVVSGHYCGEQAKAALAEIEGGQK